MSNETLLALIIVAVVLILLYNQSNEHFDTYWNHSIGAQDIYRSSEDPKQKEASKHTLESERLAGYTWSARAPSGMQLYDHYYDAVLLEGQLDTKYDPSYFRRDLESDYLDTKFQTLQTEPSYTLADTLEHNPLYTVYNGEYITLSQKTY